MGYQPSPFASAATSLVDGQPRSATRLFFIVTMVIVAGQGGQADWSPIEALEHHKSGGGLRGPPVPEVTSGGYQTE